MAVALCAAVLSTARPATAASVSATVSTAPARAIAPTAACDTGWIPRVYRATKPSVVRIERPDGGGGTGFVFYSRRHVATAFHVVDLGRSLMVHFPDGKSTRARVVAHDDEMDLAIFDAQTLKDKRRVVLGLKTKLRQRFNVSVAELDTANTAKRCRLGLAMICGESRPIHSQFDQMMDLIRSASGVTLLEYHREFL